MYAPYQIPRPKNWQDLETLCLALWKKEWNTKSFKTYGRPGQHQDGVDIFGRYDDGLEIGAIQCKCKEEEKTLTEKNIQDEVDKAKKFKPAIKRYIIATTHDSDVKLDTYVATLCQQNLKAGLFSVDLFCWQDIEKLLEQHIEVRDWYLNLEKRKNQSCEVTLEDPTDLTSTLCPVYKRTHYVHKTTVPKPMPKNDVMDILRGNYIGSLLQSYQNQVQATEVKVVVGEIHHTRCRVKLSLDNTSDVTMKDVRVVVSSNPVSRFFYEQKDDKLFGMTTKLLLMERMIVGDGYVKFHNMEDMHPKDARYLHEFYIEPPQDASEIELIVHVTALDFVDEKVFKLNVSPKYINCDCEIDSKVGEPDYIEPYVEFLTK